MKIDGFNQLSDEELERRLCTDFQDYGTALNQEIVTRELWEAREPGKKADLLKWPVLNVFVSYTETGSCENNILCVIGVKRLQRYYMDTLKQEDVPYSFLIGGHGAIYEARGWNTQPILPQKYDSEKERSIYIGLFGDFLTGYSEPMIVARNRIIRTGMEKGFISKKILFRFISSRKPPLDELLDAE